MCSTPLSPSIRAEIAIDVAVSDAPAITDASSVNPNARVTKNPPANGSTTPAIATTSAEFPTRLSDRKSVCSPT